MNSQSESSSASASSPEWSTASSSTQESNSEISDSTFLSVSTDSGRWTVSASVKLSRPQNFDGARRRGKKIPCLWACGNYFFVEERPDHMNNHCPKRNDVEYFKASYDEIELVRLRHPEGRPKERSSEELFIEEKKQSIEFENKQRRISQKYLEYWMKNQQFR